MYRSENVFIYVISRFPGINCKLTFLIIAIFIPVLLVRIYVAPVTFIFLSQIEWRVYISRGLHLVMVFLAYFAAATL